MTNPPYLVRSRRQQSTKASWVEVRDWRMQVGVRSGSCAPGGANCPSGPTGSRSEHSPSANAFNIPGDKSQLRVLLSAPMPRSSPKTLSSISRLAARPKPSHWLIAPDRTASDHAVFVNHLERGSRSPSTTLPIRRISSSGLAINPHSWGRNDGGSGIIFLGAS